MSSAIFSNLIISIQSNLYPEVFGSDPLLGTDKENKKVKIRVNNTCNDK